MLEKILIFDFDGTLTKTNSFPHAHRDIFLNNATAAVQSFEFGMQYITNRKQGLEKHFYHDSARLSCVATYHNNAAFIAGFLSALIGRNLSLVETIKDESIAVNRYRIIGLPDFLIAYIPCSGLPITDQGLGGPNFEAVLNQLTGKNDHITSLLRIIRADSKITKETSIHFYDDALRHFTRTPLLPIPIHAHLVDAHNAEFTIVKTHSPANLTFSSPHILFSNKKTIDSSNPEFLIEEKGAWLCNRGSRE